MLLSLFLWQRKKMEMERQVTGLCSGESMDAGGQAVMQVIEVTGQ